MPLMYLPTQTHQPVDWWPVAQCNEPDYFLTWHRLNGGSTEGCGNGQEATRDLRRRARPSCVPLITPSVQPVTT